MFMPSPTVENYLKQILCISLERDKKEVPMGLISEALQVTPGTATSMVKNLEKEGWLTYKSRKGVKLTASGRKLGMNILRRHRLLETFLVFIQCHDIANKNATGVNFGKTKNTNLL